MSPITSSIGNTEGPARAKVGRGFYIGARWLLLFLVTLGCLYAVYGSVNMTFFRAENGAYLWAWSKGWGVARSVMYRDLVSSHGGHYTPLLFWFELGSSGLCGTSALCWRLRQLTLVSLLLLALCSFFGQALARFLPARTRWIPALGLSAPLILSPRMIGIVGWPIESSQLLWAVCTVLSLRWLRPAATAGADGGISLPPLWISLAFGYGSMHMLGLGLATMVGWFAAYAALLLAAWRRSMSKAQWRAAFFPGAVGALLTIVHAILMAKLIRQPVPGAIPLSAHLPLPHFLAETLGYTLHLLVACVRALWSPDALAPPTNGWLDPEWPYGLATILLLAAGAGWAWRVYAARPSPTALGGLCWYSFSLAGFFFYLVLTAVRVYQSGGGWLIYLLGDRYLWTPAILLLGFVGAAVLGLGIHERLLAALVGGLVLGGTLAGNLVYQRQVAPVVWPWTTLSHETAWRQIVAMTLQLRRVGLPVPNLFLDKLTLEYNAVDLHTYEALLRRSTSLPTSEHFAWCSPRQITPELWTALVRSSPDLDRLSGTILPDVAAAILTEDSLAAGTHNQPSPFVLLTDPPILSVAELGQVKDHPNLGVDVTVHSVTKKTIWLDPPTTLTFRAVKLGQHPTFVAGVAMHPLVCADPGADGAVFQVDVRVDGKTERLAGMYVNPVAHPEQRCWMPLRVDLARFAGRTVDLILSNSSGPAGNDYGDWCLWGDPEVAEEWPD